MVKMEMYVFGLEFQAGFHFVRELYSRLRQSINCNTNVQQKFTAH